MELNEQIGIAREAGFSDEEITTHFLKQAGYDVAETPEKSPMEMPKIMGEYGEIGNKIEKALIKYPNTYGAYGAVVGTATELTKVSYLKYLHPDEVEKYKNLPTDKQTRQLLIDNLELIAMGTLGPISKGAAPIIAKHFPKTYKMLTKGIGGKTTGFSKQKFLEEVKPTEGGFSTRADTFGQTVSKSDLPELKTWHKEITSKLEKMKDPQEKMTVAFLRQAIRESIETAEGTAPARTFLKSSPKSADKVEAMYDESLKASKQIGKTTPGKIYKDLKSQWVDTSGNIKKDLLKQGDLGKEAVIKHDLIAGAQPRALQMLDDVDKEIFGKLNSFEQKYLDRTIQSRRTIAIENYKDIKHPKGLGAKEHQEWLDTLPPKLSAKLNERADAYFTMMRSQTKQLLDEGIINKEGYQALIEHEYSPRQFLQHLDPDRTYGVGGSNPISVPDSGIKRLAEGSEGLLESNSKLLLEQVVSRTQGRIFRNRANKALYDIAERIPDNGIVRKVKVTGKTKEGTPIYEKTPAGHEQVSVMIEGQAKEMLMPSELAKEWVMRSPEISPQLANFIGWISGNKILKPMATGLNPEFALTNFPRDIGHVWLTTQEYSSLMPVAGLQMGRDLTSVMGDVLLRKGAFKDYIHEGGGMQFLTHQGAITSKKEGVVAGVQSVLGWFGETSEIATRLMLRKRALRNGKSAEEATWIARNYLDFSQGGSFAKAVDTGVPYLNASIQGTRGIVRSAAQHPGEFVFKVAQIGTAASGLYMANKHQNPEAWSQVSDRDKVNNWIITTPFSYKDKDGTKKYIYMKIAKDQGQRVFATVFENLMAKYMGEDVNADQIVQAIEDGLPILPTGLMPPSLDAVMGYAANKDFWRNEDIWRGPENIDPKEQYTRYTHPGFVAFGQATDMSPQKTKYALSQYFTSGNIYTSATGYAWNKLLDQSSEAQKQLVTEELVLKQPFIRRMVKSTDPYYKYEKKMKDIDRQVSTEKFMISRSFDTISQNYYDKKTTKDDVKRFINSMPITERERLWGRHIRRKMLQDLPDKRWWLEVGNMATPEGKALVYWNKWRDSKPDERKQMDNTVKKLPWIRGSKFFYKLKKLKAK